MLFSDYCDFDLYEFFCPSGGVFQNLWGSVWYSSGSGRRTWHGGDEWCETWSVFQWSRFRISTLCGCGSRKRSAGKTWPDPGTGSFYRYNCNLQLYGDDHAFDAGKSDRRGGWYGTFTGGNGLPSGTVWCDFHCSNTLAVQFLYFSRYFILCKIKYIISVWRWNAAAESL